MKVTLPPTPVTVELDPTEATLLLQLAGNCTGPETNGDPRKLRFSSFSTADKAEQITYVLRRLYAGLKDAGVRLLVAALLLGSVACAVDTIPWTQQKELVTCQLPNNKWGRKEAIVKSRIVYSGNRPYRQFYIVKELSDCGAR